MISPRSPKTGKNSARRAPRKIVPHYIYTEESLYNLKEVVLSVINGIGMDTIDPVLFMNLIGPLNDAAIRMHRCKNFSAVKQIDQALDYISEYIKKKNEAEMEGSPQHDYSFIYYSNPDMKPIVESMLEGEQPPPMSPKDKREIMAKLQVLVTASPNEEISDLAQTALNRFNATRKLSERIYTDADFLDDESALSKETLIERVQENVHKMLRKNKIDEQTEIEKLDNDLQAQLNLVQRIHELYPPKIQKSYSADIAELKKKQRMFNTMNQPAKALRVQNKIEELKQKEIEEYQNKMDADLEARRNQILTKYEEKRTMKQKYYKMKAIQIRESGKKEIIKIERTGIPRSSTLTGILPRLRSDY